VLNRVAMNAEAVSANNTRQTIGMRLWDIIGPKVFGSPMRWKRILKLYRAIDNQPRFHMV
jgi:hypothetical protein